MKLQCIPTYVSAIAVSALMTFAGGCKAKSAGDADNRDLLVVSVEPQRYILEKIAGDRFRIVTLMPNGSNPETYEPAISSRMAVDKSRIFFTTGFFPFENAASLTITPPTRLVNTSNGIDFLYGTHNHDTDHSAFLHTDSARLTPDPHVWTSVRNAQIMAANMAGALMETDPDNADEYRENLNAYTSHLDSLDRTFAARLSSANPRTFMVWHPSLGYFARDYDLEQLAVSSESKETSMGDMRRIIDHGRADSVKVFFYQAEYDSRQAKAISTGVGSKLVEVSPQAYDWEAELSRIIDVLTDK